jgi:hypothetical protein
MCDVLREVAGDFGPEVSQETRGYLSKVFFVISNIALYLLRLSNPLDSCYELHFLELEKNIAKLRDVLGISTLREIPILPAPL